MNKVSNEDFEIALSNQDNRKIIAEACRTYKNLLNEEELKYRGHMALFKCLVKHNKDHSTSFTSSLYRHTIWQCQKALRDQIRHPPFPSLPAKFEPYQYDSMEVVYVRDCMDLLPPNQAQILRNYYFDKMNFREIGEVNGYSPPAAFRKLKQAEEAFRRIYGDD